MKTYLAALFLLGTLSGCSDPAETLRRQSVDSYSGFWQQPEQIVSVRRTHNIPDEYEFQGLQLVGGLRERGVAYSMYEWSFRFLKKPRELKEPRDIIEVRRICYYDTDSVVQLSVKEERIHWLGSKIAEHSFRFEGDEDH